MWKVLFGISTERSNLLVKNCSLDHIHIFPSLLFPATKPMVSKIWMEAAKAHWGPQNHPLWNDISLCPCSAGCQSELSIQNVSWWVMQELLILLKSPVPPGQVDFLGRWPHKPSQQKSGPLLSPWDYSCLLWFSLRLLPAVTQRFPIDFNQLFPNRFPREPSALPTCPRCSAGHGMWCCQWLSGPHSDSIQYSSGLQGSCTHLLLAQSRNSDILLLYKQKSSFFLA